MSQLCVWCVGVKNEGIKLLQGMGRVTWRWRQGLGLDTAEKREESPSFKANCSLCPGLGVKGHAGWRTSQPQLLP